MAMTTTARFTSKDYDRLPEGFPAQLIDGMLVKEPAPTDFHQALLIRLVFEFADLVGRERLLLAPLDVHLDDGNVYQPDVAVFSRPLDLASGGRRDQLPILVVEVLSPSTGGYDRGIKTKVYLERGVKEVWLVDPDAETVSVRTAETTAEFAGEARIESRVLPDLVLTPVVLLER